MNENETKWEGGTSHGLGEAPLALPMLSLCEDRAGEEEVVPNAIQISCAPPKPRMMEANGSEICQGLDAAASQFRLGMCFLRGKGVEKNHFKVIFLRSTI
jgi:TPR repeat protein